jgi:hypothetical protein
MFKFPPPLVINQVMCKTVRIVIHMYTAKSSCLSPKHIKLQGWVLDCNNTFYWNKAKDAAKS